MGLMVTGRADATRFIDELLAEEPLWLLAEHFDDSSEGLSARIADLEELISTLEPAERAQAELVLSGWKHADPLPPRPGKDDTAAQVAWIVELARQRFDFRWGRERSYIPTSRELLRPELAGLVYELADRLGMREPHQAHGEYDLVVVLGGLIRANVNRSALAASLLSGGSVRAPQVTGLAGVRELGPGELDLARGLGCPFSTEQDSLAWGLQQAFGTKGSAWSAASPGIISLSETTGPLVTCGTAPTPGTKGRADTQSAFQWLLDAVPGITTSASRVLCVTSAIYWIDGHIRLLTQLPTGCELVTTGTAGGNENPLLAQTYLSQQYLQEIKSAINALPGLLSWAAT